MRNHGRPTLGMRLLLLTSVGAAHADNSAGPTPTESGLCTTLKVTAAQTVKVPKGIYRPFFKTGSGLANGVVPRIPVAAFRMDAAAVTRAEYLQFLCSNPAWRKSSVKPVFAEQRYLANWPGDLDPGPQPLDQPVTHVSWFAARAYCAARSARLPTVAEWERAASGGDSLSSAQTSAGTTEGAAPFRFAMGKAAADLQQSPLSFTNVWEWTADFNSVAVGSERNGSSSSLFCGDGVRSNDARNYAAFLRYSFRSSLRGSYTLKNLGFRCVEEIAP